MIRILSDLGPCMPFINGIKDDPVYSDPHFCTPEQQRANLFDTVGKKDYLALGVFRNDALIGLFNFMIIEAERYVEMLIGFSRAYEAYKEIADYLAANYAGFQADFVFNPQNDLIIKTLEKRCAAFDPEMQKMVLTDDPTQIDTDGIVPLSDPFKDAYIALHTTDCYWTGEKVADAPDMFNAFLAVDDGVVVGYLDITHCFEENEIYDFKVKEAYRRQGWGRKLLKKAIESNRSKEMMLFVEVDNIPALRLYESAGFRKVPGQNSQMATWNIPPISE